MRPDEKKIAALALLTSGRATISEVALLAKTSRQRVHHWTKYGIEHKGPPWPPGNRATPRLDLDVKAARAKWLAKQWKTELATIKAEDRAAKQEWRAELDALRRR